MGIKWATASLCGLAVHLFANPQDGTVVAGSATFTQVDPTTLEITAADRTIVNWGQFSIDVGETTRFVQPSATAAVLNRVTSSSMSVLSGLLEGNGQVYLINPNGILVGPTGVVNTASFIASSLDVLDAEFLNAQDLNFRGESRSSVVNLGAINVIDGDVFLISHFVENQGTINASEGAVGLAAGRDILLRPAGVDRIAVRVTPTFPDLGTTGIQSAGSIAAVRAELRAEGSIYELAIRHTGSIQALDIQDNDGRVTLEAPMGFTEVAGSIAAQNGDNTGGTVYVLGNLVSVDTTALIDVSAPLGSGNVFVGGSFQGSDPNVLNALQIFIDPTATITTDALDNGTAGQVVLWAEVTNLFYGTVFARGGPNGGDGGFVELSGLQYFEIGDAAIIDRTAPLGIAGTLLLDPTNLTISTAANANLTNTAAATGVFPRFMSPTAPALTTNLSVATLTGGATGLGAGSVVVQTGADSSAGDGDIHWLDTGVVALAGGAAANSLTLISANNITMNGSFSSTGASNFTMIAAGSITFASQAIAAPAATPGISLTSGSINLTAGVNINLTSTLRPVSLTSTVAGATTAAVNLTALNGSINLTASNVAALAAPSITITSAAAPISLKATRGNISLSGGSSPTAGASVLITNTGTGSITLDATTGNISLAGGSGATSFARVTSTAAAPVVNPIILCALDGNVFLQGGTGVTGDAQVTSANGPVNVIAQRGSVVLQGSRGAGAATTSFAQITATLGATTVLADLDCTLTAGNNGGTYAEIFAGTVLNLRVGRNCILQGGTAATAASLSFTGTAATLRGLAGIQATIGNNFIINGGTAGNTFAGAFSNIGNMNFSVGANLLMTAGTATGAFTQIGSFVPTGVCNILFSNVGGSVILQGSQTAAVLTAGAAIGLGTFFAPGAATLSGDITFTGGIGANLILNGGVGSVGAGSNTFNYAKIGHFGLVGAAPNAMIGNVRINNVGNNIILTPSETTATIGHGTTPLIRSTILGNVSIDGVGGDILMNPGVLVTVGAVLSPTTQIGHFFGTTIVGDVSVNNISGNIAATAGTFTAGSAIIGHGNNIIGSVTSAQGQIDVLATNVTLTAGGTTDADAIIGFSGRTIVIAPAPLTVTAVSDITLLAGTAAAAPNGSAIIGFSNPNAVITTATISSMAVTAEQGNINLVGGASTVAGSFSRGLAFIGMNNTSAAAATISRANLVVNVPNGMITLQGAPSGTVLSFGNGAIRNNQLGRVDLFDLVINAQDITLLGGTLAGSVGTASIYSSRNATFNIGHDLTLNAGFGNAFITWASIAGPGVTGASTGSFDIGHDLNVIGGGGAATFAQIGTSFGILAATVTLPMVFTNVGGDVLVRGGTGLNAYALIGHGRATLAGLAFSGDVIFSHVGGDFLVEGGSTLAGTFGHVGHVGSSTVSSIFTGDVILDEVEGAVRLTGGTSVNSSAIIGHGDPISLPADTYNGQVVVNARGVQLTGGSASGTMATIGFETNSGGGGPVIINSNRVEVNTEGPVTLTAGVGSNAVIGFFSTTTSSTATIRNVSTTASNGNVTLSAGTPVGLIGGNAVIGTRSTGGTSQSDVKVTTAREIILNGPVGGAGSGAALIVNNRPGVAAPFNVSLDPATIILLGGTSAGAGSAVISSSANLSLIFSDSLNVNFDVASPATLQTGSATITAMGDINLNSVDASSAALRMVGGSGAAVVTEIRSVGGNINLGSPSSLGADSITIGSAAMGGAASLIAPLGDVFANVSGDISVFGGGAAAALGQINANDDLILRAGGNISLLGAAGLARLITTSGLIDISSGNSISVGTNSNITNGGAGGNSILAAALINLNLSGTGFISNTGGGDISVEVGQDISMTGSSMITLGGTGKIRGRASRNVAISGTASVTNTGTGELYLIADYNMDLTGTSTVSTAGGTLHLIVDNEFPDAAKYGTGRLLKAAGATVTAGGGATRLYTARQPFNSIAGLVNGVAFLPGTQYVDTTQEIWNSYFNRSLEGAPLTVFYKDVELSLVPPSVIVVTLPDVELALATFAEALQDWRIYDDFIFSDLEFALNYQCPLYREKLKKNGMASCQAITGRRYRFLRPSHRNYHTKKLEVNL